MATRLLNTGPEWEHALRSGLESIEARLVDDDVTEFEVGDVVRYPGSGASQGIGSAALVTSRLMETGTGSLPDSPVLRRCVTCWKQDTP